jgi:hypothetical protein
MKKLNLIKLTILFIMLLIVINFLPILINKINKNGGEFVEYYNINISNDSIIKTIKYNQKNNKEIKVIFFQPENNYQHICFYKRNNCNYFHTWLYLNNESTNKSLLIFYGISETLNKDDSELINKDYSLISSFLLKKVFQKEILNKYLLRRSD